MSAELRVELGRRAYPIVITHGESLDGAGIAGRCRGMGLSPKMLIVSSPRVYGLYGEALSSGFRADGFELDTFLIPDGEEHKTLQWIERCLTRMLGLGLDRGSAIAALGGGVIGDMAGFAASLYMRGIRFIQVPTTLLAQVDSSVGGKTGVNHELGKNLIGAFWQPSLVWADVGTLGTLPRRELLAGLAEVIKYGVIRDEGFFDYLAGHREAILALEPGPLEHIVRRSCEIKAEVVAGDEREGGLRAILNFGHTIGHAVEKVTGYRVLHGEGVAIGMCMEAELSARLGICGAGEARRVREICLAYGLPVGMPAGYRVEGMLEAMRLDKKVLAGSMRFVLPERVGRARVGEAVGAVDLAGYLEEAMGG